MYKTGKWRAIDLENAKAFRCADQGQGLRSYLIINMLCRAQRNALDFFFLEVNCCLV